MNRIERIIALSQKDEASRREAMKNILIDAGLTYTTQEAEGSYKNPLGIVNYIVDFCKDSAGLLFSAHYDAIAGSSGANDNAASVAILIELALELQRWNIPATFVFFDCEEVKQAGSRHFVNTIERSLITGAINLDLCGFGDTMAIYTHGNKPGSVLELEPFTRSDILEKHHGVLAKYLPKSDDAILSSAKIPSIGISVMPRSDIAFLKALATYDNGIWAKPPEYDMMIGQMEVSTSMHGGYRDNPKWLDMEAMDMVYEYLIEAVKTQPQKPKKKLRLF